MKKFLLVATLCKSGKAERLPQKKIPMKEKVLQARREFGAPVNAGKIAEITGIDRKEVDKAFAELKKEGAIVSPVRCKWQPA